MSNESKILIITEKPSVAKDIAKVVGADKRGNGYFSGTHYDVTWAIGHLVTLPLPHEIKEEWKDWKKEELPLLPKEWPLQISPATKEQFLIVKKLISGAKELVCATDAGREGELIFRYIYEASKSNKPFKRLWISSLTEDAIKEGLRTLKDGKEYDNLYYAARARSQADWIIGMNLSRAYSLAYNQKFFVGRVQTPTLAMIVNRDNEIKDFKPEKYTEVRGNFKLDDEIYAGMYVEDEQGKEKVVRFSDLNDANKLVNQLDMNKEAKIEKIDSKESLFSPPALYDLTELQRHANGIFSFSASKTLELAQALYEKHKLISYPRTSSRHLSESVSKTLKRIVDSVRSPYESKIQKNTGETDLGKKYVDDKKITDHHAIIPNGHKYDLSALSADEFKIYDLICRRFLMPWQANYKTSTTTIITVTGSKRFKGQGVQIKELGWKALEIGQGKEAEGEAIDKIPSSAVVGKDVILDKAEAISKTTKAPARLTEGSLLTAMETAGKALDDKELADAIKETGLGTPATRASIIENLILRGLIKRDGKAIVSTGDGAKLIDTVNPLIKSPELTAMWEKKLEEIQDGKFLFKDFMNGLELEVAARVSEILKVETPKKTFDATQLKVDQEVQKKVESKIKRLLTKKGAMAAGKIFLEIQSNKDELKRSMFEAILTIMASQHKVKIKNTSFEKDGKKIEYRHVSL